MGEVAKIICRGHHPAECRHGCATRVGQWGPPRRGQYRGGGQAGPSLHGGPGGWAGEGGVGGGVILYPGGVDPHWEYMLSKAIGVTIQNPGLGGAPLFDLAGRVVGIAAFNVSEVARTTIAIPVELYQLNRTELLEFGQVVSRPMRAWIGAHLQPTDRGVMVAGLVPGGPAEAGGGPGGGGS